VEKTIGYWKRVANNANFELKKHKLSAKIWRQLYLKLVKRYEKEIGERRNALQELQKRVKRSRLANRS
jgi:hypothetical protein